MSDGSSFGTEFIITTILTLAVVIIGFLGISYNARRDAKKDKEKYEERRKLEMASLEERWSQKLKDYDESNQKDQAHNVEMLKQCIDHITQSVDKDLAHIKSEVNQSLRYMNLAIKSINKGQTIPDFQAQSDSDNNSNI